MYKVIILKQYTKLEMRYGVYDSYEAAMAAIAYASNINKIDTFYIQCME